MVRELAVDGGRVEEPVYRQKMVGSAGDLEYRAKLVRWLFVALIAGSAYLFVNRPDQVSTEIGLLGLGVVWAGMLPMFHYLMEREPPPFPFLPMIGAFYTVTFGMPVFSKARLIPRLQESPVTVKSLVVTIVGLACLYAGYALFKHLFNVQPLRLPRDYSEAWLQWLLWLLLIVHLLSLFSPAIRDLPSASSFIEPAGYVAYGMFFVLWKRRALPPMQKLLLLGVALPIELLWRFTSGALVQMSMFGLFATALIWYERKRLPLVLIALTVVVFAPLQPIKSEYRRYTWEHGRYANLSTIGKAKLFIDLAVQHYSDSTSSSQSGDIQEASVGRIAHIRMLSYVMSQTPEPVPYWGGETYTPLFTKFIPRLLWKDKPEERVGQDFGHRYGFLAGNDAETSINLPWMAEMYANFGLPGVWIGMALVGLIFGFLTEKLDRHGMSPLEFMVGLAILLPVPVSQEANLSLGSGNLLLLSIAMVAFFRIALWIYRPSRPVVRAAGYY